MVILNALIGVILKLTSVYASIFDLVQFIIVLYDLNGRSILDSLYYHFITCSDDNRCFLVEKFGNLFYLISLPWMNSSFPLANLIEISQSGFNLLIDFLTDTQKEVFKAKIKSKYRIEVTTAQIKQLIPSELKCTTKVVCSNGRYLTLHGEANYLLQFPLEVEFDVSDENIECFEHHLIEHNKLEVDCVIRKKSKAVKTFSIDRDQMNESNLLEKLFGVNKSNEVYVTRQQMDELAAEIFRSMSVYEEYQIGKEAFMSAFIDGLIKQNVLLFKPVPIDTVLKSLSKYSIKYLNLNFNNSKDNIEWESLKVSRLFKSSFNKKLNFEKIKRIVDYYILDMKFSIEYKNGIYLSYFKLQNTQKVIIIF